MHLSTLLLIGCGDTSELEAEMRTQEVRIDALEVQMGFLSQTVEEQAERIVALLPHRRRPLHARGASAEALAALTAAVEGSAAEIANSADKITASRDAINTLTGNLASPPAMPPSCSPVQPSRSMSARRPPTEGGGAEAPQTSAAPSASRIASLLPSQVPVVAPSPKTPLERSSANAAAAFFTCSPPPPSFSAAPDFSSSSRP